MRLRVLTDAEKCLLRTVFYEAISHRRNLRTSKVTLPMLENLVSDIEGNPDSFDVVFEIKEDDK